MVRSVVRSMVRSTIRSAVSSTLFLRFIKLRRPGDPRFFVNIELTGHEKVRFTGSLGEFGCAELDLKGSKTKTKSEPKESTFIYYFATI